MKKLFEWASNPIDSDFEAAVDEFMFVHWNESTVYEDNLEYDILYDEISASLQSKQNNKSPGPDGIIIELCRSHCSKLT